MSRLTLRIGWPSLLKSSTNEHYADLHNYAPAAIHTVLIPWSAPRQRSIETRSSSRGRSGRVQLSRTSNQDH